jgi:hypothetical protein
MDLIENCKNSENCEFNEIIKQMHTWSKTAAILEAAYSCCDAVFKLVFEIISSKSYQI